MDPTQPTAVAPGSGVDQAQPTGVGSIDFGTQGATALQGISPPTPGFTSRDMPETPGSSQSFPQAPLDYGLYSQNK